MELEKNIRICDLLDIYGVFLSKKQQEIAHEYYFLDNSLSEVAQNFSISRQAVLDSLNKSSLKLEEFEEKLKLLEIKKHILNLEIKGKNEKAIKDLKNLFKE